MKAMHQTAAMVVSEMGSPRFNETLIDAFQMLAPFDSAMIVAFDDGDCQPICLTARHANAEVEHAAALFLTKYFSHFRSNNKMIQSEKCEFSISRYRKSQINNDEYKRDLYDMPGISYEMELLNKVDGFSFYLGLFRSQKFEPFSKREESIIADFWSIAFSCIIKNARLTRIVRPGADDDRYIRVLTESFLCYGITKREAEICAYIVAGYSALAMSMIMNISTNTVSTLRQRAYRKLNISSHSELYALYLKGMEQSINDSAINPDIFCFCSEMDVAVPKRI